MAHQATKVKVCRTCGETNQTQLETFRKGGKAYTRNRCKSCKAQQVKLGYQQNPERVIRRKATLHAKRKAMRAHSTSWHLAIYEDSRRSDQRAGRENDLDREFIRETISTGCSYCGETTLRMTLDRIDNTLGHLKSNVVAACIRCNYARRSMPFEAWLCLSPGLREARARGLFGDWTGRIESGDP